MTDPSHTPTIADVAQARRREMAVEHLLFGTIRFVAQRHPELLGELDRSLDHLWDSGTDETRDDEAVRTIARRLLKSLHSQV